MASPTIKLVFDNEIKKVSCVQTYQQLLDTCQEHYKIQASDLKFHYVDEDDDPISISCEDDVKEMFNFFKDKIPKIIISPVEVKGNLLQSLQMVDSFDEEEEEEKYPEEPNSVGTGPDYVSSKEGSI